MRSPIYKTLWGAVGEGTRHRRFTDVIPAVAAEGWDGVAFAFIAHQFDDGLGSNEELGELCREHGLDLAVMVHTFGRTAADHLDDLTDSLETAASLDPHHVICHGGADWFDDSDSVLFLSRSMAMAGDLGLTMGHETHRSRILFNPWVTARMLDAVADLQLVVDLSHWVVVAERLVTDAADVIDLCGAVAIQVDARVGHEQGPQVPDPAAPEWAAHVTAFEAWWTGLCEAADAAGREELVFVPEYGPPPYQQTLPWTGAPTTDLWTVTRRARDRLRTLLAT